MSAERLTAGAVCGGGGGLMVLVPLIGMRCTYLAGTIANGCIVQRRWLPASMPVAVSACCSITLTALLGFGFVCRMISAVAFNQLISAANLMALPLFVGVCLGC